MLARGAVVRAIAQVEGTDESPPKETDRLVLATVSGREGETMCRFGEANFHQEGQRGTRLPFRCSRRSIRNGESTQLPSIDTLNSLKFVYRPTAESFHRAHT